MGQKSLTENRQQARPRNKTMYATEMTTPSVQLNEEYLFSVTFRCRLSGGNKSTLIIRVVRKSRSFIRGRIKWIESAVVYAQSGSPFFGSIGRPSFSACSTKASSPWMSRKLIRVESTHR